MPGAAGPRRDLAGAAGPGNLRAGTHVGGTTGSQPGSGGRGSSGALRTVTAVQARVLAARDIRLWGIHLTGVDLRPTLQNPQVRRGFGPAAPTLAAGR